ncbi:LuxR family transcriptional regulator [Streptomyces sp. AJS327]|uniref:helix-turn-helix transcriptional regulator n=1 Tax=Streptomyces sp. AJS327 TaxID=2545265 RepID=UPI0015DF2439|nr:LuxR family transcriptional regulator [Streptomyces sp. AJS327]
MRCDPSRLIERRHHIQFLDTRLRSGKDSRGGFVLVEGAFGTGKTALLNSVRSSAEREGFVVLRAKGSQFESGFPYGIVRQLFEETLAAVTAEQRAALLDGQAVLAAPLFDYQEQSDVGDVGELGTGDPEWEEPVRRGLHQLIVNLSSAAPVVLLIDDLHWADEASLRFLRHSGSRLEELPVLCCASAVDTRGDRQLADARASLDVVSPLRLPVGPLTETAVTDVLGTHAGVSLEPEAVRALYRMTSGNPFLLRELVTEVRQEHGDEALRDPHVIARAAPRAVARAVQDWIQCAPAERASAALELASALAVLEAASGVSQLAGLAGLGDQSAEDGVAALRDLGIISPDSPLRFTSPVVRNALYEQLPQSFRYRVHWSAAQSLDEAAAPPERVAQHLLHAPPVNDDGRTARILVAAATTALHEADHSLALALFRRALRESVQDEALPELLAGLGEAEARLGEPGAIEHLTRALELTEEPIARARVALHLGRELSEAACFESAMKVLRTAHDDVREVDEELALCLQSELVLLEQMLPDKADRGTRGAELRDREPIEGPGSMGSTLTGLARRALQALLSGKSGQEVEALCDEALARAWPFPEVVEDPSEVVWPLAFSLHCCGRLSDARTVLDDTIQHAVSRGFDARSTDLRALRGMVNLARGMLSEAESDAAAFLREDDTPERSMIRPYATYTLTELLRLRGQPELAAGVLAREGVARESTSRRTEPLMCVIARGRIRMGKGEVEAAVRDFTHVIERLGQAGLISPAFSPAAAKARGLTMLGRHAEARRIAGSFLDEARRFGGATVLGRGLATFGLTMRGPEGVAYLEEAARVLEGSSAVMSRVEILLHLGSELRRNGQFARARKHLRVVVDLAESAGAVHYVKRAREDLAAMGVRLREPARTGPPPGLTPREYRVAALAAGGKRNHEIARILFVTVKTVEWHLSQVYRKLGIASRAELAHSLSRY